MNDFKWNETIKLKFAQAATFIQIAVSPKGELYGIQKVSIESKSYNLAYNFNFETGEWTSFLPDFQLADIQFDAFGNYYLLDTQGNLYARNSKTDVFFKGVSSFGVQTMGELHIVLTEPTKDQNLGSLLDSNGQKYKLYNKAVNLLVAADCGHTIITDKGGVTYGYGYQCVKDISIGTDGSIWAISCDAADDRGNFDLIKWDPLATRWYKVYGINGVKIASFNEISAVILDVFGRIQYTSNSRRINEVDYLE